MNEWGYAERILSLPSVPLGLSHLLPDQSGMYIAVITNDTGSSFVGYVGISGTSIYRRWGSHRIAGGKARGLRDLAAYAPLNPGEPNFVVIHYDLYVGDETIDALREAEAEVIAAWNPPLNGPRWGRDGTPLMITDPMGSGSFKNGRYPVYVTPEWTARHYVNCHTLVEEYRHVAPTPAGGLARNGTHLASA
jgi:hypothetical protein